jgi:hypothetical protein
MKKAENVVDIKRAKPGTHIKPIKANATQLFSSFRSRSLPELGFGSMQFSLKPKPDSKIDK